MSKRNIIENKEQVHVFVSGEFKNQFQKHCEENGYNVSSRIRFLMKKDMDQK